MNAGVTDVDQLLEQLDAIIQQAIRDRSCIGYFATLARLITVELHGAIEGGVFDDAERMSNFDVIFGNRFLDAWSSFCAGRQATASWQIVFDVLDHPKLSILQHLMLAMNAHLNFDLAIAAVTAAPGDSFPSLSADFKRINTLLSAKIAPFEAAIGQVSPRIAWLDALAPCLENELFGLGLVLERQIAWENGMLLSRTPEDRLPAAIDERDRGVASLGRVMVHPPLLTRALNSWVRRRESTDVAENIGVMMSVT